MADATFEPIYFGPANRRLYGVLHLPAHIAAGAHAAIVCGPFGREAIRVHRLLRVVADRLARQGVPVLRFDYYGAGESEGLDDDADLEGWSGDIEMADREVRRRMGLDRVVWLGIRLGATAVARALARSTSAGVSAVFWDPVCDGNAYLEALQLRHAQSVDKAFSIRPRSIAPAQGEALGYALPGTLANQIRQVSIDGIAELLAGRRVRVLYDPTTDDGRRLAGQPGGLPAWSQGTVVEHDMDWLSSAAENVALVPAPAVSGLMKALGEFQ